ncbi:MAG: hypothetical protein IJ640_13530 [Prevotella sp.]|nr:hypothetical protein [Prevotella sp.]MBR1527653.1 hypothetical protein [Prevotella sp.]
MLQSEFYELTKVTLDGERYKKVEAVYNEVEMLKPEFCAEWKKLRENKLMGEVETAIYKLSNQLAEKEREIARLKEERKEAEKSWKEAMAKKGEEVLGMMANFAKRIIRANSSEGSELRVYDVVEEEYGIGFIIKAKHEAGIPLSEDEIKYMVGKL